jgi:transposase
MAGKGSKIMLITDGQGLPLGLQIADARPHELHYAEQTIHSMRVPRQRGRARTRPAELIADKAYDSRPLRRRLQQRGIKVTIPIVERRKRKTPKRGPKFALAATFRLRWKIERTFAWMDNCRRLVVRYERKPEVYAAFCKVCFILWTANRILK